MESKNLRRGPPGVGEGYKLVGLGGTFAAAIILATLAGWVVDRWLRTTPLFTLVGTGIGAVMGFLNVYWKVQADIRDGKRDRAEEKDPS
jgi:F0F1-type ATP synthase assembly protein I